MVFQPFMRPHVIFKIYCRVESFSADLTVVSVGACMGLYVLLQVASCGISFTTDLAGKSITGLLIS